MSENDLVRRGDVLTALERHRSGDMPACDWNEIDGIQAAESLIRDLPADRVAQAAVRLAEKVVRDGLADFARFAVACRYDCEHAECLSIRYREAVIGQSKEPRA